MHKRWLLILALACASAGAADIKIGAPLPRIAMVKEGTHHWLTPDGKIMVKSLID
ncbi:MAG TPA: hypothetical protein VGD52_11995 [Pseudoduganella sp.]